MMPNTGDVCKKPFLLLEYILILCRFDMEQRVFNTIDISCEYYPVKNEL